MTALYVEVLKLLAFALRELRRQDRWDRTHRGAVSLARRPGRPHRAHGPAPPPGRTSAERADDCYHGMRTSDRW